MKIDIELVNGKIVCVYSSEQDVEVNIYEDLGELTDEQESEMEIEAASVPYIVYQTNEH